MDENYSRPKGISILNRGTSVIINLMLHSNMRWCYSCRWCQSIWTMGSRRELKTKKTISHDDVTRGTMARKIL